MRAFFASAFAAILLPLWGAVPPADDINVAEVIQKFAAKESEFAKARGNYTYHQVVRLQVLDSGGNPNGEEWYEEDDIIFTPEGKRIEKPVKAPVPTLRSLTLTSEDQKDLRDIQPFVLTAESIPDYQVDYLGREKVDEIGCYAFSVKPRKMVMGKRYFEGQVWVDDRDLQIVKSYGKGVGLQKRGEDQQFPRFETYREQIDGKYWFPTYTRAEDTLHFKDGQDVRIRQIVKYQNYKQFVGRSTIRFGDEVEDKPAAPPKK
jgi:hypothetical protein